MPKSRFAKRRAGGPNRLLAKIERAAAVNPRGIGFGIECNACDLRKRTADRAARKRRALGTEQSPGPPRGTRVAARMAREQRGPAVD